MATNWGFEGGLDSFCKEAKVLGYDGIEVWVPRQKDIPGLLQSVEKNGLELAVLTGGFADEFEEHYRQYQANLKTAVSLNPAYINCHAGKDYFSFEQNLEIIRHALSVSASSGIPVYQETHRGRMLFNAPLALQFLEAEPGLKLTLDISHWCCVHESLLQNQQDTIGQLLDASDHIHARIGHAEGPQIPDPEAPEWKAEVAQHFSWWDTVVKRLNDEGKTITICPEFGPPNYMPALPYTRQAIADNWKVNARMKDILRKRYL